MKSWKPLEDPTPSFLNLGEASVERPVPIFGKDKDRDLRNSEFLANAEESSKTWSQRRGMKGEPMLSFLR